MSGVHEEKIKGKTISGVNQTKDWLVKFSREFLAIDCGDWTYGSPTIHAATTDRPRVLKIGRYCSLAVETSIHVGIHGQHPLDTLTTYPLSMAIREEVKSAKDPASHIAHQLRPSAQYEKTNLDVVIGHDVWIGHRSTIMAGVVIGTGAVIGAGSIVTKDVEPYSIVAGVPARHIRYRHEEKLVSRLLDSCWWTFDPDELWSICGSALVSRNVEQCLDLLDKYRKDSRAREETDFSVSVGSVLNALMPDLANSAQVLGRLAPHELHEAFTEKSYTHLGLPVWPEEEVQRRYTGGAGVPLMERAFRFGNLLAERGEFKTGWRGLEFGVGWGRLASSLLRFGSPEQLDCCDAWATSLDLAKKSGLKNKLIKVSEVLKEGELPLSAYDVIYAFSVFTHLDEKTFQSSIKLLLSSLRKPGRLYLTVRHGDFIPRVAQYADKINDAALKEKGFVSAVYPNGTVYGESVCTEDYVRSFLDPFGRLDYLGLVDVWQHLYVLSVEC
jgi:acetyltransferase-like isoleucine patch superfamily enzyme